MISQFTRFLLHKIYCVSRIEARSEIQKLSRSTSSIKDFTVCGSTYGVRNLGKTIRFNLKSRPLEQFHWSEMSQIKAGISFRTSVKSIFHKNVGWQRYQWIP